MRKIIFFITIVFSLQCAAQSNSFGWIYQKAWSTSGTNTYTVTIPNLSSLTNDLVVKVKFVNANTSASTLNINSTGAKNIYKNGSSALASGDLIAGQTILVSYDGTNYQILGGIGVSLGSGITNSAANNELMKSNGTNAVPSGVFIGATAGDLVLGTSSSTGTRQITVNGTGNVGINITPINSGSVSMQNSMGTATLSVTSSPSVSMAANNGSGVGSSINTNQFQNQLNFTSSATNTIQYPATLIAQSTGTPSSGFGSGIQFETENASTTVKIGSTIESVSTNLTSGSEAFDLVFKNYSGGSPNEKFRIASSGNVSIANGNLTLGAAGNKFIVTEGSNGYSGQVALVSGTKAITISGVTTSSRCLTQRVTPSGTSLTVQYDCVCTSNTVTIQADVAAGTINTSDASTMNYWVWN